jgi:hypothetical protein
MIHVIAYDLHAPGRDYPSIEKAITSNADSCAHPQGSVWFVDTLLEPKQWVSILNAAGDANDEYIVSRLAHNWWSQKLDADVIAWFKSPSRRW